MSTFDWIVVGVVVFLIVGKLLLKLIFSDHDLFR